jgi:hypothetical protein
VQHRGYVTVVWKHRELRNGQSCCEIFGIARRHHLIHRSVPQDYELVETINREGPRVGLAGQVGVTVSMVTVLRAPLLCEVAASPWSNVVPRFMVKVDPAMSVHVVPSTEA